MCAQCEINKSSRRAVLAMMGAGAVAGVSGIFSAPTATAADGPKTAYTPDQALAALKDGNKRYVSNPQACVVNMTQRRHELVKGQAPWAVVLGCSDSRVPPELVFGGLSLGELFVIRNAGNTVDTAAMGTIEYGIAVLGAPLLVVLGHENCGAVVAACEVVNKSATYPGAIGPMIEPIIPAAIAAKTKQGDFVDNAVRENVSRTVGKLTNAGPIVADFIKSGKIKVVGGRYDLDSGEVNFFV